MFDLSGKASFVIRGAGHLGFDFVCALAGAGCDATITSGDISRASKSAANLSAKYGVDFLALS